MPPLLPELLNQPVQIVVQSQPTDWWSVGGTVAGTLLGAALGALMSGVIALKIMKKQRHLDGIEQLQHLLDQLENKYLRHVGSVADSLEKGGFCAAKHQVAEKLGCENEPRELGILPLVAIHAPQDWDKFSNLIVITVKLLEDASSIMWNLPNEQLYAVDYDLAGEHRRAKNIFDEIRKSIVPKK